MPAKIRSAHNLPQEAVIVTYICFLTNFTELELTNIQANYWWGQMHCGPSNHSFGWAMTHPAHAAVPHAYLELAGIELAATRSEQVRILLHLFPTGSRLAGSSGMIALITQIFTPQSCNAE